MRQLSLVIGYFIHIRQMTQKFVENLRKFNRKERFYLTGMALGNQDFAISKEFTSLLHDTFKVSGIDFHDKRFAADVVKSWINEIKASVIS